jgi:hypothetical protein
MKSSPILRWARTCLLGAAYLWPLAEPPALTSTFGEFRANHFHGGIDLSTSQRNGLEIRAIADGTVIRVRASGVGYGRAVYQLLDDGNTAVYAHLDGFAPDLAAWVAAVQESTASYEQDLEPPANRFRYRRGEVIAYSGESGAGPPHLHIEVRTGVTAINPLRHGLPVADGVAPLIRALWVYPAKASSRVEGRAAPLRLPVERVAAGRYRVNRQVRVSGEIRAALEAQDRSPARSTPLGLYEVGALIDSNEVFLARLDSVSWLKTREVKVVFDPRVRAEGTRRAYSLTPPAGLETGVVRWASRGWALAGGVHDLEAWAEDAAGNRSRLTAKLEWMPEGETPPGGWRAGRRKKPSGIEVGFFPGAVTARVPTRAGAWLVTEPPLPPATLEGEVSETERIWELPAGRAGRLELAWLAAPGGADSSAAAPETLGVRSFVLGQVEPGRHHTLASPGGEFAVDAGEGTAFETHPLALEVRPPSAAGVNFTWGAVRSAVFRLLPGGLPLKGTLEVRLQIADGVPTDRVGLFLLSAGDASFVGGLSDDGGRVVSGHVRSLGSFAAISDTLAPTIARGRLRYPRRQGIGTAEFELRWIVRDRGSGIGTRNLTLWVDDKRVPVEYDADARSAVWRPFRPPATGLHRYRLQVEDRLGNRTTREGSFRRS